MRSTSINISILVPCRNERNEIEPFIKGILKQERPPGTLEIIVADGMSDDGTRDVLDELARKNPALRVIDNPGRIVSTGLNRAIEVATGDVIIRLDVHTEYAPDYILQCVKVLQETNADNVGGPWVAKGNGFVSNAIAAAFQSPFGVGGAKGHAADYEGIVDTVYLGCWRRDVFDRIGLFDETLVRNQDDEFNLRLSRAGGKIWQSPRIRSWYHPRGSLRNLVRQYAQYGYWKVRVIQKHKVPASVRHIIPGGFVLALLALPTLALWSQAAGWAWLALIGVYGLSNIVASVWTGWRTNVCLIPVLPIVFASYHLAYGFGFLRGVWDFVIAKSGPRPAYAALTRAQSKQH